MAIGILDSAIFADMFGTAAMRAVFGDRGLLARMTEVEAALARAQARLGMIPDAAAAAISEAATAVINHPESLDLERLKRETETVGYPVLPLVRQLAERAGEGGRYLHWGATTQDIMDTAAVLQMRAGLALLEADLTAVRGHLADLARRHRDTPMAGAPICSTRCRSPSATRRRSGCRRSTVTRSGCGNCARACSSCNSAARPAPSPRSGQAPRSSPAAPNWRANSISAIRPSPGMSPATALPRPYRPWRCSPAASARLPMM